MTVARATPARATKPCGLVDGAGGKKTLLVGHDDSKSTMSALFHSIPRPDVASVLVEAVVSGTTGLRMDICSKPGKATTDYAALLESAKWPWQRAGLCQRLMAVRS